MKYFKSLLFVGIASVLLGGCGSGNKGQDSPIRQFPLAATPLLKSTTLSVPT